MSWNVVPCVICNRILYSSYGTYKVPTGPGYTCSSSKCKREVYPYVYCFTCGRRFDKTGERDRFVATDDYKLVTCGRCLEAGQI
jgi:hypothetical protein